MFRGVVSKLEQVRKMNLLRRVFGDGHDEVWKQLSDDLGAKFIKGGFFKDSKVEARIKNWTVTLDTYTVSTGKASITYTRMRAPFVNDDGFRFLIYRQSPFSAVGKLLGMQDVEVGGPKFESLEPLFGVPSYVDPEFIESSDTEFDTEFIIKSNDEEKVGRLFKPSKIRELIRSQPAIELQLKSRGGWFKRAKHKGSDELHFQVIGVITDLHRLKLLFELYGEVLSRLHSPESASEEQPPG
jgi:hypothetical protein